MDIEIRKVQLQLGHGVLLSDRTGNKDLTHGMSVKYSISQLIFKSDSNVPLLFFIVKAVVTLNLFLCDIDCPPSKWLVYWSTIWVFLFWMLHILILHFSSNVFVQNESSPLSFFLVVLLVSGWFIIPKQMAHSSVILLPNPSVSQQELFTNIL